MLFEDKEFPTYVKNVGIDSKYRDLTKYPSASEYVVVFDDVFHNIVSVQLVFAVYEKTGTETYVNLRIDELSPNLVANSSYITGSFCQLPMVQPVNVYDMSMFKTIKQFDRPLSKLGRLTIQFVDSDGKSYPMRDHFLKFEVVCLRFNSEAAEWNNNEMFSSRVTALQPSRMGGDTAIKIIVPDRYDLNMLKNAFKAAYNKLKASNLAPGTSKAKYAELKNEFKLLASRLT